MGQARWKHLQTTSAIGATQFVSGRMELLRIIFKALALTKNGMVTSPAMVTVLINGVLVQK